MTKQELEKEIDRRDHLLRQCYFRVRQVRDGGRGQLLAAMKEWAPATPIGLHPNLGARYEVPEKERTE